MKIAVVSPIYVVPSIEGNRSRILALIRQLRGLGHEVHLILLPTRDARLADIALHEAEMGADRFVVVPHTRAGAMRHAAKRLSMEIWRKLHRRFGSAKAYYQLLDEYYFAASTPFLRRLQAQQKYDAVFVEYAFSSRAFEAFPAETLKVLDTHDTFVDRHVPFGKDATNHVYWYSIPLAKEVAALRRADMVIAIQEQEEELFRSRLGGTGPAVVTVSHALATHQRVDDFSPIAASFIGSVAEPNVDAINYFTVDVLPRILEQMPEFRLKMAGAICKVTPDHPAIDKLGRVGEVIEAYTAGPLAINPMRVGTGINIKLLEAMAHGVGTVSTRTGVRGLGEAFGGGVVTVNDDDPAAMASEIVRLLRDRSARARLGESALASAKAWNHRQIESLERLLETKRGREH